MESRTTTDSGQPSSRRRTLYERIGEETIVQAITEFYIRAFQDPIIGHIFMGFDRESITAHQIKFAIAMLGGPKLYRGKPLVTAHKPLPIRPPHFGRRQVLMREVLDEMELAEDLKEGWLTLEENLRPLILQSQLGCNHPST